MNVAVTGLAPHNEAAFGVFLSRSMPGWSWRSVPTGAGAVLPAADIYVADMVSLGLPRWSQQGQAELFRLLRTLSSSLVRWPQRAASHAQKLQFSQAHFAPTVELRSTYVGLAGAPSPTVGLH